jgi:hypothetical protein
MPMPTTPALRDTHKNLLAACLAVVEKMRGKEQANVRNDDLVNAEIKRLDDAAIKLEDAADTVKEILDGKI